MNRVVAVLGGNAFAPSDGPMTMEGQIAFAHHAAEQLMPLLDEGTQVGHILRRAEADLEATFNNAAPDVIVDASPARLERSSLGLDSEVGRTFVASEKKIDVA